MKQSKTTFNHHQQWKQKRLHADGSVDLSAMPVFNYHLKDHASASLSPGFGSWNTITDAGGIPQHPNAQTALLTYSFTTYHINLAVFR